MCRDCVKENKASDSSSRLISIKDTEQLHSAHCNSATEVVITSHDQPGTVVEKADSPRSYVIETPTKNIRRDREHLVPLEPSPKPPTPKESPELNISSRPHRTVKPSLKALENMAIS